MKLDRYLGGSAHLPPDSSSKAALSHLIAMAVLPCLAILGLGMRISIFLPFITVFQNTIFLYLTIVAQVYLQSPAARVAFAAIFFGTQLIGNLKTLTYNFYT